MEYGYTVENKSASVETDYTFLKIRGTYGSANGQFTRPSGFGADLQNNVYVADSNNHRIQKFDGNGTFITKWGYIWC